LKNHGDKPGQRHGENASRCEKWFAKAVPNTVNASNFNANFDYLLNLKIPSFKSEIV